MSLVVTFSTPNCFRLHSTCKHNITKPKSVTSSSDGIMFTDADLDTYGEFAAEEDSQAKSVTGSQESVGVCSVSSQQSRFQSKQGRLSALSNRSRNSSISTKSPKLSARYATSFPFSLRNRQSGRVTYPLPAGNVLVLCPSWFNLIE